MKVHEDIYGDTVVLTLKGEFDSFVTSPFSKVVKKVRDDGRNKLVLNMALVTFVNSTALGAMIRARKDCKSAGGDMMVSAPSAAVKDAMDSLGLDRLFGIYDDDEQAVAALGKSAALELSGDLESTVMISAPGQTKPVVGRMRTLERDGVECRVPAVTSDMVRGREMRLKFRLPRYRKDWFDLKARIESVAEETGHAMLGLRFTDVSPQDLEDIERFLDDMDDLREAARGEG